MKLDPTKAILDFDDKPIMEGTGAEPKPVTFGLLAERALTVQKQGQSGTDQYERYKMALKFHGATEPVELTVAQVGALKVAVAEAGALPGGYSVLVYGRLVDIIEGAEKAGEAP